MKLVATGWTARRARVGWLCAMGGLVACANPADVSTSSGGAGGASVDSFDASTAASGLGSTNDAGSGGEGGASVEIQPTAAGGKGVDDPQSSSLHGHDCGGTDWQVLDNWLLLPHKDIETRPAGEIDLCVTRYAGWVTNEADSAKVSRASVYAALDASGQCDATSEYDGALLPSALCVAVHPDLDAQGCLDAMKSSKAFGIRTVAQVLAKASYAKAHDSDPPLMATLLGKGAIACGGTDRWKLDAPTGYVDRYVAAYNSYRALEGAPKTCSKHVIVSVALYTGMDAPGDPSVEKANGCWTYERVSKTNHEWNICGYDGTNSDPNGVKWAYDDTSTEHDASLEVSRIHSCQNGASGRGYVYMTNRGAGWPQRVTQGVRVHFAELYSGQFAINDQFGLWKNSGTPGDPMINVGEASTSATEIHDATLSSCNEVANGEYLGLYIYPESLRTSRMSAFVHAVNQCTQ